MTVYAADYLPRRISQYVPSLEYSADVVHDAPYECNLGAPAALSANGILSATAMVNGSAVTVTSFVLDDLTTKCTYGRNITAVASSTNTRVMTVYGKDYLGEPLIEAITLTSATTVQGAKAFMYIDKIVFASASDTTTVNVGWGDKLGLPYKTFDINDEYLSDVLLPKPPSPVYLQVAKDATQHAAGTVAGVVAPVDGKFRGGRFVVTEAIVGNDTITASLAGGSAMADFSITHASAIAVGTVYTDTVSGTDASHAVSAGEAIFLINTSTPSAGAISGYFILDPDSDYDGTFVAGDDTTATSTTGDTRGTYTPSTPTDGTNTYKMFLRLDHTNLHGVQQYFA